MHFLALDRFLTSIHLSHSLISLKQYTKHSFFDTATNYCSPQSKMQDQPTVATSTAVEETLTEAQEQQDTTKLLPPVDEKNKRRESLKGAIAGLKAIVRKTKSASTAKTNPSDEPVKNDQYKKAEALAALKKDVDELEAMLPRMRQAISILALDDVVKPADDTAAAQP